MKKRAQAQKILDDLYKQAETSALALSELVRDVKRRETIKQKITSILWEAILLRKNDVFHEIGLSPDIYFGIDDKK